MHAIYSTLLHDAWLLVVRKYNVILIHTDVRSNIIHYAIYL